MGGSGLYHVDDRERPCHEQDVLSVSFVFVQANSH